MSHITQHKIDLLYNSYKEVEITFNKDVINLVRLIPDEIYLKCGSLNLPCILHSTSFEGAKIIAQLDSVFFDTLRDHSNWVSLRFAFGREDSTNPLTFFIKSKIANQSPFKSDKPNLFFIYVQYNQKPPDALIEIIGSLLEAKSNAEQRKDERINITPDKIRELKLKQADTVLILDRNQRKCLLRDISFSGAKIVAQGNSKEYSGKQVILVMQFVDPDEKLPLLANVLRCDEIKDRKDFTVLGLEFVKDKIPLHYKLRINEYLSSRLKITSQEQADEEKT
ncbi:MAG: PilZ domain-containing protein [Spirochaetales bacterium]|nr:PilZ domain-containing protein [Spirochaetales bacterium]